MSGYQQQKCLSLMTDHFIFFLVLSAQIKQKSNTSAIHSHGEDLALLRDGDPLGCLLVAVRHARVSSCTDDLQLIAVDHTQVAFAFLGLRHNNNLGQKMARISMGCLPWADAHFCSHIPTRHQRQLGQG